MKKKRIILLVLIIIPVNMILNAEIVHVQSNDSQFFYVCDEPINVRSEGNLSGKILDKLYIGEKVVVLEKGSYAQIDGGEKNYWYKIKYRKNQIGWIYGKYLATQTIVIDLDKNGKLDYIFVQMHLDNFFYGISPREDITIYINGNKISTSSFNEIRNDFSHLYFYLSNNAVFFSLENVYDGIINEEDPAPDNMDTYIFMIKNNDLKYIKTIHKNKNTIKFEDGLNHGEIIPSIMELLISDNYFFINFLENYDK